MIDYTGADPGFRVAWDANPIGRGGGGGDIQCGCFSAKMYVKT